MKENDKKQSAFTNVMFIFKFMKKYWLGTTFVVVFLILASFFQVISPKILSDSMDKLQKSVIQNVIINSENDALAGRTIKDKDNKKIILKEGQLDKNASKKEIKEAVEHKRLMNKVFYNYENKKNSNIISGKGFTKEQKETIKNSKIDKDFKNQLLGNLSTKQIEDIKNKMAGEIAKKNNISKMPAKQQTMAIEQIKKQIPTSKIVESVQKQINLGMQKQYVMLKQGGYTKSEQNKIKNSSNSEEIKTIFNIAGYRNYIMNLDKDSINNELGFTDYQINYMNHNLKIKDKNNDVYEIKKTDLKNIKKIKEKDLKDLLTAALAMENLHLDQDTVNSEFNGAIWLLFLSYVLTMISMLFYNVLMASIASKSTQDMRDSLFRKIEALSIRFFDQSNDGDLLSRFINDIDNIATFLNQSFVQMLSQVTTLIGIIIMMFQEDKSQMHITFMGHDYLIKYYLAWMMILYAIVALVISTFIIKKARKYVGKQQEKLGDLNGYIDERISGQKVISSYGLETETVEGFEVYNDDFKVVSIKGQIYSGILMPIMQGIGLLNLASLIFMGATFVANGVMTIGVLLAFIQYSQRFFNPLAQMLSQYNLVELATTGAGRVKEVMDQEREIKDKEKAEAIKGINGEVSLENVDFGYYPDKLVLKNINIEVKKGQMIALVGPTGSGKTTVMNLMNRFYDVTSGDIKIDGKSIKDITLRSLRTNVGIVLQESILFSGTVKENIAYGKDNATDEEIINAAKTANIHDFILTLENGYDTHVDNNTSAFSVGQKQLMSIARTILTNPDLLILDEATSNVDTVTEAKIQKAMENVLQGRTSFVIAHRLKTILNADKIIVLKDGEIIEEGSHEELLKAKGFYSELYHNQFVLD